MNLMELLPEYYKNSAEMLTIQNAIAPELEDLQADAADVLAQIFVNTATWGLVLWEAAYGLKTDAIKSFDMRRMSILAKMRGQGTTTKNMVKNVAESFVMGAVEIVESAETSSFNVKFLGQLGEPPNLADLTAALEEIKPAHLAFAYILKYRTHADLESKTHEHLSMFTHNHLKEGEMN